MSEGDHHSRNGPHFAVTDDILRQVRREYRRIVDEFPNAGELGYVLNYLSK
jgi:hypothetical protein